MSYSASNCALLLLIGCAGFAFGCGGAVTASDQGGSASAAKPGTGNAGSGNTGAGMGMGNMGNRMGTGNAGSGNTGNTGVAGTTGVPPVTTIDGKCSTAADCVAVVDTRPACSCGQPIAASQFDVMRDPCLVSWNDGSYANPPAGCRSTGGPPCMVDCPMTPICAPLGCVAGQCELTNIYAPTGCGAGGYPSTGGSSGIGNAGSATAGSSSGDCNTLSAIYSKQLAAAQVCNPAYSRPPCAGFLPDVCGCQVPYDSYGPSAKAAENAYAAWQSAQCPIWPCQKACVGPPNNYSGCIPSATGAMGTCQYGPLLK